jgi:hypothetical protein
MIQPSIKPIPEARMPNTERTANTDHTIDFSPLAKVKFPGPIAKTVMTIGINNHATNLINVDRNNKLATNVKNPSASRIGIK